MTFICRCVVVMACFGSAAGFEFDVNALFSDGMVLQTSLESGQGAGVLRGTAVPGSTTFLNTTGAFPTPAMGYAAVADKYGVWTLSIANHTDPTKWGPFTLTLGNTVAAGARFTADDVYFGDVYLCGGQSNMERAMNTIANKTAEYAAADHPDIRLFAVPKRHDAQPPLTSTPAETLSIKGSCLYGGCANPCTEPVRTWRNANETWIQHFSAICYMTARDVARDRGTLGGNGAGDGRRIGLIEDDLGGTPVQAWSPPEALQSCGKPVANCTTEKNGDCIHYPSALYNTMISPLAGIGLRAFLWMQGEANSDEGFPMLREEYACAFSQMIRSWRKRWSKAADATRFEDIPFLFVQISSWYGNWGFDNLPCTANYCPVITRIRLAQADVAGVGNASLAYTLPHVGMAVSHDSGDTTGVHSRYKSEPARRLSWQVRAKAFHETSLNAEPPMPDFGAQQATWKSVANAPVTITVPVTRVGEGGITLSDSIKCNKTYDKSCCTGKGLVTARVCVAEVATECETDNSSLVFDAEMAVGNDKRSLVLTTIDALPSGATPHWLDMFRSDFPLCVVVDKDSGLSMSAFAFLKLSSSGGVQHSSDSGDFNFAKFV